jgi:hypothetical protein
MNITLVAMWAGCVACVLGCAASSESNATDGTTGAAGSTQNTEKAVREAPSSTLSVVDEGKIGGDPPGDGGEGNQICEVRTQLRATNARSQAPEPIGEATECLTKWQQVCIVGCQVFATAGCTSVSLSCTAGAVWSFGGILIPCAYAVLAACTGATAAGTVCTFKCVGG